MNPLAWTREHQIALALAVLFGAFIGCAAGYLSYAAGSGAEGSFGFSYWIQYRFYREAIYWTLFGALCGGGIVYIRRLLS